MALQEVLVMHLQLVPINGEPSVTDKEKSRQKRRTRPIPPETINYFTAEQQQEIKIFLAKLVVAAEQCHHNMEILQDTTDNDRRDYLEKELEKFNERRINLFENLPYFIRYFIKLIDLCPSEPWKELEEFLNNIRNEDKASYHQTTQSLGIEAAMNNTYLLQVEEDLEEEHIELQMKCRITPREIETLILYHPLEVLVKHLINARRVSSGEFWDKGFYDL